MKNLCKICFISLIIIISACSPELSTPVSVEINGHNALDGGHLFQGKDSLVVISSIDGMDVISVFKGKGEDEHLQITVSNPTDSTLEINSLKVLAAKGEDENSLWKWQNHGSRESPELALNLSGSSLILLPEERIILPTLKIFSHLCSD